MKGFTEINENVIYSSYRLFECDSYMENKDTGELILHVIREYDDKKWINKDFVYRACIKDDNEPYEYIKSKYLFPANKVNELVAKFNEENKRLSPEELKDILSGGFTDYEKCRDIVIDLFDLIDTSVINYIIAILGGRNIELDANDGSHLYLKISDAHEFYHRGNDVVGFNIHGTEYDIPKNKNKDLFEAIEYLMDIDSI